MVTFMQKRHIFLRLLFSLNVGSCRVGFDVSMLPAHQYAFIHQIHLLFFSRWRPCPLCLVQGSRPLLTQTLTHSDSLFILYVLGMWRENKCSLLHATSAAAYRKIFCLVDMDYLMQLWASANILPLSNIIKIFYLSPNTLGSAFLFFFLANRSLQQHSSAHQWKVGMQMSA